ncbi:hypothetical protein [Streptacidiphilus anmyonensis]|nr:hypothetical protein [Streptacidiphilus anmyonensis]
MRAVCLPAPSNARNSLPSCTFGPLMVLIDEPTYSTTGLVETTARKP